MAEVLRIVFSDFRQGLNTEDAAHIIPSTQSPILQNVDLSRRGIAATRSGTVKLNTTAYTGASAIYGAFYGKSVHLAAGSTTAGKLVSGAYTNIKTGLTALSEVFFEEWDNYVWSVNGADAPWKWDGTTVTAITSPPTEWTANKPNFLVEHENRLWGFTASTSFLTWSKNEDGDQWLRNGTATATSAGHLVDATLSPFIAGDVGKTVFNNTDATTATITAYNSASDVTLSSDIMTSGESYSYGAIDDAGDHYLRPNDGYTGTGLISQKNGLVVFKQQSIHKVLGKTPVSFLFKPLYTTIGCIAPRSIVNTENRIFFLAKYRGDYGVWVLDEAGGLTHMSRDITPTLNLIDTTADNTAAAVVYKDKYRLMYPLAAGGWASVNLNIVDGGWEKDSGNAGRCAYTVGGSCYVGSTTDGHVRQIETGTNDDGTAIDSYIRTKSESFEAPEIQKHLLYVAVWVKASGNWNLNMNVRVDDKLLPSTYTAQLGTKGAAETTRVEKIILNEDVIGNTINLEFGTSVQDQPFEIYQAILFYEYKKIISR